MVGICSYGGYVPRFRLDRKLIYKAMGWINPAVAGHSRGEKAVANFDEDSITMAVAAGIDALGGTDRSEVEGLYFASTSMPYRERLNAGIITAALGLDDRIRAADFTGAIKCGTTALLAALETVAAKGVSKALVTASDCRLGKPASPQEMIFGDAAAAFTVGSEGVIAEYRGSFSTTYDFVDHYRGAGETCDRQWEERWIRDAGMEKLIPEAVEGLLSKLGMEISDFSRIVFPCIYPAARKNLAGILGFSPEVCEDNLQAEIGESGCAHPLVMLTAALEKAAPGDNILVVSFGSGCDALCFTATDNIREGGSRNGISKSLACRAPLDNYAKYLVWRNILPGDLGLRSEEDEWTRWTLLWRKRKEVLGLWGTKCRECGTAHYPRQKVCVNPECGKTDDMAEYRFSDKIGRIDSFTGDNLAASLNPPAIYGQLSFEGGGKYLFDLTDCELSQIRTGMPVAMSFRKKYEDKKRGVSGYFWKAVPEQEVK